MSAVRGAGRWLRAAGLASAALALASSAAGCSSSSDAAPLQVTPAIEVTPVAPENLCVTHGTLDKLEGKVAITEPAVRAVAIGSSGEAAALRFTYGGRSEQSTQLKSGQLRRQLGLKLRAADGCNLVYVMWRIEPKPGLEVSVKRQPGKHTAEECGNEGYTKVKPRRSKRLPFLKFGVPHTLQAELTGDRLAVWLDGDNVWQGRLDKSADGLVGPAGMRTDNVQIEAELLAAPADPAGPSPEVPGCPKPTAAPPATPKPSAPPPATPKLTAPAPAKPRR